jgi:hypothetical protein
VASKCERKELTMFRTVTIAFLACVLFACSGAPEPSGDEPPPTVGEDLRPSADQGCDYTDPYPCMCKETYALCQHRCLGLPPGPWKTSCLNGCANQYYVCVGD